MSSAPAPLPAHTAPFETDGFLLRRNLWLPGAGLALVVLGVLGVWWKTFTGATPPSSIFASSLFAIWFGLFLAPLSLLRNAFPLARRTHVQVTPQTLHVAGIAPIDVADIVEAKSVPRPGKGDVVVELGIEGRRRLKLWLSWSAARAMLAILQAGPGQRRTVFRTKAPYRWSLALSAGIAGLPLTVGTDHVPLALFGTFFISTFVQTSLRRKVAVGADGFTWRWLFLRGYVPFRDVASITSKERLFDARAVITRVNLRSGHHLTLSTPEEPDGEAQRGTESHALYMHLHAAFAASQALNHEALDVQALLRGSGKSGREWLAGIDLLVRGGVGGHYRIAAVDPVQLVGVVGDPGGDRDARIGAAAALLRMNEEGARTKVRIAAAACADPVLREELIALSEGDDGSIEHTLERSVQRRASVGP